MYGTWARCRPGGEVAFPGRAGENNDMNSTDPPFTTGLPSEWDEDTRAVMNKLMYGTPVPPEIYERIRKRAEAIRERMYREHGLSDMAAELTDRDGE
jgi:hypothetical protein